MFVVVIVKIKNVVLIVNLNLCNLLIVFVKNLIVDCVVEDVGMIVVVVVVVVVCLMFDWVRPPPQLWVIIGGGEGERVNCSGGVKSSTSKVKSVDMSS